MKKAYLFAMLFVASLAAIVLFGDSLDAENEAAQPIAKEKSNFASPGANAASTIHPPPAPGPVANRGGLAEELRQSPSFRAFVYRALRNPEKGGYLYAQHVISLCRRTIERRDVAALNDEQRAAAISLMRRCDMTKEDLAQYDRELPELRDTERDPLFGLASDGLVRAKSQEERNDASTRILATKEPLLLRIVSSVEVVRRADGTFTSREYFDGKWYGEDKSELLEAAWALANCELGADCGANAPVTLQLCVEKGWCGETLQDAIERSASGVRAYDEILSLKSGIVSAINRQDIRPFIGPDGNPLPFK